MWNVTTTTSPPIVWDLERSDTRGDVRAFSVGFSPRGGEAAVGQSDGRIDVWRLPPRAQPAHGEVISGIAQNRAGAVMATVGADTRLNVWTHDRDGWRRRGSTPIQRRVNDRPNVAISDDGRVAATANNNGGSIELWDLTDPDRPRQATTTISTDALHVDGGVRPRSAGARRRGARTPRSPCGTSLIRPRPPPLGGPLEGPSDLIRAISVDDHGGLLAVSSTTATSICTTSRRADDRRRSRSGPR